MTHSCPTRLSSDLKAVRNRLKTQALDQLLKANPIELPQALVQQEIPRMRDEAAARMNMANLEPAKRAELLPDRSEEHTSELQSLMRISYAVFCLKKNTHTPCSFSTANSTIL